MKAEIYKDINVSAPESKLKKLCKGLSVTLTPSDLKEGDKHLKVHHLMYKKMMAARKNNKGCRLMLSPEEIHASGSILDDIWSGVKSGVKWLGTQALNGIQQGAKDFTGNNPLANKVIDTLRSGAKDLTGLGLKVKKTKTTKKTSTEDMKAKMARVRSFKKNAKKTHESGSFLLY